MKLKMLARTLAPAALLIVAAILVGCSSPTIATVNGKTISAKEFQDRFQFEVIVATGGSGLETATEVENAATITMATMISEEIARQKAAELQITVSDSEYREALAGFPNLEELVTAIGENTDLQEEKVRELWRAQIEGRILMQKLAAYYERPENDLIRDWNSESEIDISEDWKAYIPAN